MDDFQVPAELLALVRDGDCLVLWHRTPAAAQILKDGFRDGGTDGGFILAGTSLEIQGVFVSNRPLNSGEGTKGQQLLHVLLAATEDEIADYEIVEDGKPYREWCVPSALLNTQARVNQVTEGEEPNVS